MSPDRAQAALQLEMLRLQWRRMTEETHGQDTGTAGVPGVPGRREAPDGNARRAGRLCPLCKHQSRLGAKKGCALKDTKAVVNLDSESDIRQEERSILVPQGT